MDIIRIAKTITPAVVVLVAGLLGMNFLYNSYMDNSAATVITLEPAAGEEMTTTVEDTMGEAVEAVEEAVEEMVEEVTEDMPAVEDAVEGETTEGATEEVEHDHAH